MKCNNLKCSNLAKVNSKYCSDKCRYQIRDIISKLKKNKQRSIRRFEKRKSYKIICPSCKIGFTPIQSNKKYCINCKGLKKPIKKVVKVKIKPLPCCIDCGKELKERRSKRCYSCAAKKRPTHTPWNKGMTFDKKPKPNCLDCGVELKNCRSKKCSSCAAKGRKNNPFQGKKHTEETKQKISKANKGNTFWLGKKHTEETKQKISKANKGKKSWNEGVKVLEGDKKYTNQCRVCGENFKTNVQDKDTCPGKKCYNNSPKMRDWMNNWFRTNPKGKVLNIKRREKRLNKFPNESSLKSEVIELIWNRDKHCVYCGKEVEGIDSQLDHFNSNEPMGLFNGVIACRSCNASKGSIPVEKIENWIKKKKLKPDKIVWELLNYHLRKNE